MCYSANDRGVNTHLIGTKQVIIRKIGGLESCYEDDLVVEEVPLSIRINGLKLATLMCTPTALEHLVRGYLLTSGVIKGIEDVISIQIGEQDSVAIVTLTEFAPSQQDRAVTSGCGKGEIYLQVIQSCRYNESQVRTSAEELLKQVAAFNKMSALFLRTGGVHSAAIASSEGILLFHEDIGRHNAVDKLIGEAVSQRIALEDKTLITSGRVSSEIMLKAARLDIPVIVSRSAPTAFAVELAERLNITLIGFARGNRMNVYAAETRIDA
jgi:FdhD protein